MSEVHTPLMGARSPTGNPGSATVQYEVSMTVCMGNIANQKSTKIAAI